ncbi:MAG TPA: protein translocase subunit SecF [Pyrinomonadaceae bacterium]|jgi:preprotein translocase subunit SecF|nr:protein translocase subunit SecF [Pyrinomonadaceae bacterium]
MFQILHNVNLDWLRYRKVFILISTTIMLAGLASALIRHAVPGGAEAFNLGIDFKGGTVVTADFKQRPAPETIRNALHAAGVSDPIIQPVTDKPGQVLIRLPKMETGEAEAAGETQVDIGRKTVAKALRTLTGDVQVDANVPFPEQGNAFKIVGTDAVGAVAGNELRNRAVAVTLAALVGILLYISFRFEWTYGAAAVIAVFHDVLVTLGFFSIFQFEVNLTVIAALLTLVGFSVNDTIVIFDRIRENLRMHRRATLYDVTNDSINQTLSRTIITSGLVFLSVLAMVVFGGEVLRGFSVALLIGIIFGTYSSVAIASPIMVWWQQRLDAGREQSVVTGTRGGGGTGARGGRQQSPGARNTRANAAAR